MRTGFTKLTFAVVATMMPGSAWAACVVSDTPDTSLGTYSSPALQKSAAAYARVAAGFDCQDALLSLLSNNMLSVTPTSATNFKLKRAGGTDTADYVLAADSGGTTPIAAGAKFYYLRGGLINLAGLLGNSTRNVQIYVKPLATAALTPGTYSGSFKLAWEWSLCTSLSAVACTGYTQSTTPVTATVTVSMVVTVKPVAVAITTRTTYDPISTTNNPRSIPGSKQRTTITLTNTDIIPVDLDTLNIVLPTPPRGTVALDGDGTASTAYVKTAEGSPASSLAVTYTTPASTTDDVDFSANGGGDWAYDPTSTPKAVTNVRVRPRGKMAAGSSFSVSLPYVLF
ncbi:hypothetical protein HMP09_2268 [Sphingomonas sp. HMP9]|uniref:protein CsuE n=1 Tax=Sphingomonas sp. HMP9 TaxID=1517554 RepID=UPI001596B8A1|nr:protein CsuE [Sphingomonas sp. HMP9]BCA63034.1 hypothetical protein HMP09_2268 [Sphingomonas sp. HMP9]